MSVLLPINHATLILLNCIIQHEKVPKFQLHDLNYFFFKEDSCFQLGKGLFSKAAFLAEIAQETGTKSFLWDVQSSSFKLNTQDSSEGQHNSL